MSSQTLRNDLRLTPSPPPPPPPPRLSSTTATAVLPTVRKPTRPLPPGSSKKPEATAQSKESATKPLPLPPRQIMSITAVMDPPRPPLPSLSFSIPPYKGNCADCCIHGWHMPRTSSITTQTPIRTSPLTPPPYTPTPHHGFEGRITEIDISKTAASEITPQVFGYNSSPPPLAQPPPPTHVIYNSLSAGSTDFELISSEFRSKFVKMKEFVFLLIGIVSSEAMEWNCETVDVSYANQKVIPSVEIDLEDVSKFQESFAYYGINHELQGSVQFGDMELSKAFLCTKDFDEVRTVDLKIGSFSTALHVPLERLHSKWKFLTLYDGPLDIEIPSMSVVNIALNLSYSNSSTPVCDLNISYDQFSFSTPQIGSHWITRKFWNWVYKFGIFDSKIHQMTSNVIPAVYEKRAVLCDYLINH
ncbi:hypothetical protein GE061_005770 [Apolygus lucorum]|uniref:Uncharacterized protein n=1 Tax=Apolygus lucorum TaxID=248454 RepID=A0A8S9WX45_APOLU|nr:hypothetical protein GE061_005770 [Apolygus lucorum]